MAVASDKRRDLDVPKNVQLYGVDYSGHVIPISTDLSGELKVDVTIGDIIAVVSGNVTALLSSGEVHVTSGQVIAKVSGEVVSVASGAIIDKTLLSGLGVLISGQTIATASGAIINRDLLSGLQVISQSGLGVLISGQVVSLQSGTVVKISGETIVQRYEGQVLTLFSGYGTTNTLVYSGFEFLTYGVTTMHIENLTNGSGLLYNVRGATQSGMTAYTLISGSLASGQVKINTLTDPYSWVDIGLANLQSNFSGTAMVYIARR
mgnify:CR=1 FL=1